MAGQVFVLQVVIVLLLVVAAVGALVLQVRHDSTVEARNRSVAVAEAFANAPGTVAALSSPDPSAVLQPRAEAARVATEVDFIVVMNTDGIRYTHPKPDRIGKKFVGDISDALAGRVVTEDITGTIGPLVQAVVPVKAPDGKVVGLVSAGITTAKVGGTADQQLPLLLTAAAVGLALATAGTALVSRRLLRQTHGLGPHEMTRMYEHHDAVLHAVREGVLIVDGEGRLLLANDEAHRLLDLPPDAEGRHVLDLALPADTAGLLASGRVATDEVHRVKDRLLAVNQRPTDIQGGPPGSVATLRDSTELRALSGRAEAARERLDILYDATMGIGTSLDVTRTAEELAELAVPRFADFATVDLFEPVLSGGQPEAATTLRRTALSGIRKDAPLYQVGEKIPLADSAPQTRGISSGRAVLEARLAEATGWRAQDLERSAQVVEYGIHSLITVPLRAGSLVLGAVSFWRSEKPEPFDSEEVALAEELVTRAAVSIDNARRYTREHTMAVTLQRSLLPRRLPEQDALDIAYKYLPAQAGWAATGSTYCRCPVRGWRSWSVTSWDTGCTPRPRWGGCARRCTTSPPSICRPTNCSPCSTSWSPASTRTRRRRATTPPSPARPACTPSTTRSPGCARSPAPVIRRPPSSAPTAASSTRTCPRVRHSAWAVCRSRRPNWNWPRAAVLCSTRTDSWRTGNATSTWAWKCSARRWNRRVPRPRTPAGPCSTRGRRPGPPTTSP